MNVHTCLIRAMEHITTYGLVLTVLRQNTGNFNTYTYLKHFFSFFSVCSWVCSNMFHCPSLFTGCNLKKALQKSTSIKSYSLWTNLWAITIVPFTCRNSYGQSLFQMVALICRNHLQTIFWQTIKFFALKVNIVTFLCQ